MVVHVDFAAARGRSFKVTVYLWFPNDRSRLGRRIRALRQLSAWKTFEIPSGLTFASCRGLLTKEVTDDRIQRWKQAFFKGDRNDTAHSVSAPPTVMKPQEVLAALTKDLSQPSAVRVSISHDCSNGVRDSTFVMVVYDAEEPVAFARRKIRRSTHSVYHDLLNIPDVNRQGSGTGSRILRNAVTFYRELGIRAVEMTAGLDAGGAVWHKFGFRPVDPDEWRRLAATVRRRLSSLPAGRHQRLSRAIDDILNASDPRAIWTFDQFRRFEAPDGSGYGFGAWLLRGLRWRGILDLHDPEAMRRFEAYMRAKGL